MKKKTHSSYLKARDGFYKAREPHSGVKGVEYIRADATPTAAESNELTAADHKECLADHRRFVRVLDVGLNREDGAAKQASLCDIVGQVKSL